MMYSELLAMVEALDGVSVLDLQECLCMEETEDGVSVPDLQYCLCIEVAEDGGEHLDDLFAVLRGSSLAYTEEEYRTWHYTFDGFTVDLVFAAWEE